MVSVVPKNLVWHNSVVIEVGNIIIFYYPDNDWKVKILLSPSSYIESNRLDDVLFINVLTSALNLSSNLSKSLKNLEKECISYKSLILPQKL